MNSYAECTRKELMRMLSNCINSWCVYSVHAWVPDVYSQWMHKLPMRISGCMSALCVCSVHASVLDVYAEHTHQGQSILVGLQIFLITLRLPSTANIRMSIRVRNSSPRNEPLNIFIIFYFSPKIAHPERLYGVKIMNIQEMENLTLAHLKDAPDPQFAWHLIN